MTSVEYRETLRAYLKDREALNRLLNYEQESTDDELDLYINMAVSFLNTIPPAVVVYGVDGFPLSALLIHQATIECLISNGIVNTRNELTYNNGGLTVKVADGDKYLKWLQQLYRVTDREIDYMKQMKISANINACYGGYASPYALLATGNQTLRTSSIF